MAEGSIVLLKNEGNVLPLASDRRVAFIGSFVEKPRYQGAGSSMVNAKKEDSTFDLFPGYFPNHVGYASGFGRLDGKDKKLMQTALQLAFGDVYHRRRIYDYFLFCL